MKFKDQWAIRFKNKWLKDYDTYVETYAYYTTYKGDVYRAWNKNPTVIFLPEKHSSSVTLNTIIWMLGGFRGLKIQ